MLHSLGIKIISAYIKYRLFLLFAFANLQKVTTIVCLSVSPSAWTKSAYNGMNFAK